MKKLRKFTAILLIAIMAVAMAVSASAAPASGTTYEFDLSLQTAATERFYVTAISKETGAVAAVEQSSRASWSADYPAFWVVGATGGLDYVLYKSEQDGSKLDQVCDGAYKSVIAFKAPASGLYDIHYEAVKYAGVTDSYIDVVITKAGASQPLASKMNFSDNDKNVLIELENVELAEGDEIWVIVDHGESNTRSSASNLRIDAFSVTFVEEADVEPTTPPTRVTPTNPPTADNLSLLLALLALATASTVILVKKRS